MVERLTAKSLYRSCDPGKFDFETTAELEDLQEIIGQPRAAAAIELGVGIEREGYNIFALGPVGTGRHFLIQQLLDVKAAGKPIPPDWCYVNNFEDSRKPRLLELPPGMGNMLRRDMSQLVEELRTALSAAFESEEYQTRRQVIEEKFKKRSEKSFGELQERARKEGVAVIRTPVGVAFAPIKESEVLAPEEFDKLPEEERERLEQQVAELQQELQKIFRRLPSWERERREKLRELNREVTNFAVGHLIAELDKRYEGVPSVVEYLQAVRQDVIDHAREILRSGTKGSDAEGGSSDEAPVSSDPLRRYSVNALIDHSTNQGAPVVYEENPTYQNLVGQMEHRAQQGALETDFQLIKPGALHRANGGYLILDARRILAQPYAWEGLKRALQSGQVRIESLGQALSLISTVSLEPEPIPLNVKVVLIGERLLYYLLCEYDTDFGDLFKVAADFEEDMDHTEENLRLYAQLVGGLARKEELRPLDRSAVARVVEQSGRMAEDANKLSTRMRGVADLLREADYWAAQDGREVVESQDVQRAIDEQEYRSDRLRQRFQEQILRRTLAIDTEGDRVGQINGLSVVQMGSFSFGRPSRITASVRMGKGEVLDIEREVELSGPIHSKGVLILSGFLGGRYAADRPLSLAASLVFEQSYSGVDGDSASSTELYALLSAIADVPIKQSLAVTGSVNQHGLVQAVGGVNQKVEGFFDLCRARNLTGEQGVLIPASNVQHLMLRRDVVEAVEAGRFHIYPVESIDQGVEILTGLPAGERDEQGCYPRGSLNRRVEDRLADLAEQQREYGRAGSSENEE